MLNEIVVCRTNRFSLITRLSFVEQHIELSLVKQNVDCCYYASVVCRTTSVVKNCRILVCRLSNGIVVCRTKCWLLLLLLFIKQIDCS
jgi:hypothetical protein